MTNTLAQHNLNALEYQTIVEVIDNDKHSSLAWYECTQILDKEGGDRQ